MNSLTFSGLRAFAITSLLVLATTVQAQGDPFLGEIRFFAGNFAPRGWALCDGQILPIAQNTALFSILGTTYGGDGRTSFGLPDMRGRSPLHAGTGPGLSQIRLGQRGGSELVHLTHLNLPSHRHNVSLIVSSGAADSQDGGYLANPVAPLAQSPVSQGYATNPEAGQRVSVQGIQEVAVGSNTPFDNRPPYVGVNCIIAIVGTYPSRN